MGAALATFRAAADLCETHEHFIFNQNEALLYEWIEDHEPALFERIRRLVKLKRWHIMGGWYLQPDCNLPSGESMSRQIERGLAYFEEKFGVRPTTAINFDSFGHSRGLVQILAKHGFDSYLICRPDKQFCELAANAFVWRGFDGSEVLVRRIPELYNSHLGKAHEYIERRLTASSEDLECVLWGVGNHGGGPSRKDLADLAATEGKIAAFDWHHATPEHYFEVLKESRAVLPLVDKDLNRWAVGCYTSQIRIKQAHRRLENELFRAEKMATAAAANELMAYPRAQLRDAERDLLISEFHDILPGSSIAAAEEASLRLLSHGREIAARVSARAFFALLSGEPSAAEGSYPVFVYNPHPWELSTELDVEFQMADQNWENCFHEVEVTDVRKGVVVASQVEREASNMPLEWRKRVVFRASLPGSAMSRFDLRLRRVQAKLPHAAQAGEAPFCVRGRDIEVRIDRRTGHLVSLSRSGVETLGPGGAFLEVHRDVADSWIGDHTSINRPEGAFVALDEHAAAKFAGVVGPQGDGRLAAVRIIEDGAVRTVVEALYGWGESRARVHYQIPKEGESLGVDIHVLWNEKDRALKWRMDLAHEAPNWSGQTMFGVHELPAAAQECAFQQWCSAPLGQDGGLLVINDGVYAGDCTGQAMRVTLLRSAAYSAHAWEDRTYMPNDRHVPRMDQGQRSWKLWMIPGARSALLANADRLALACNRAPYILQAFPAGVGTKPLPTLQLDNPNVILSSLRRSPCGREWMFRLFNPQTSAQRVTLRWLGDLVGAVSLNAHAFENYRITGTGELVVAAQGTTAGDTAEAPLERIPIKAL